MKHKCATTCSMFVCDLKSYNERLLSFDGDQPDIVVSAAGSLGNSPILDRRGTPEYFSDQEQCTVKPRLQRLSSGENSRPSLSRRHASVISLSSVCSIEDISDLEDVCEETNKESMWLKLRKVVRWSPFIQNYEKPYPWIQLAGHSGGFTAGSEGTVIKNSCEREAQCLQKLMKDILRPYVPEYINFMIEGESRLIEMQDLLHGFESSSFVMDCKMGTRTYLEDEVCKVSKPRKDLYLKMTSVDPSEPTDEENDSESCTKTRYMQWREQLSSTSSLGFRIEGVKRGDQPPDKDFKKVNSAEDVGRIFKKFIESRKDLQEKYLQRLKAIKATLICSNFFKSHEIIGSSLLFVHDLSGAANIWLIDFGKTTPLQNGSTIDHRSEWVLGNHEDGYLIGLDNMINIWSNLL